jgi:post-segregation antitoxin (ccd killing protein)
MQQDRQPVPDDDDATVRAEDVAGTRAWLERNDAGFEAWNAYVERRGVPLARCRKF